MRDGRGELHETISALANAFPLPQPSWHGHVPEMRACLSDLRHALADAAEAPELFELAARSIEGELEHAFDTHAAGPRLAAAYRRLSALPVPAGEHPYLDEIVPTLEAMEAMLVAVSLVPAAVAAFEQLV
jgi:hypothetical protein